MTIYLDPSMLYLLIMYCIPTYIYTNIGGNIIKHNLRTSMNAHFILERVDVSVVCER